MEVTGNFSDFYGTSMLPALREVVDRGMKRRPVQFTQLFNMKSSSRSIEQFSQISGVGRFAQIDEGGPVRRDQPVQGFKSSFVHTRFGLAVATTIDVVEDDKWDLIGQMHSDLGWSCAETRELQAASVFNNAFSGSFQGPDGVALCSTSHPLYKIGGNQSNLMTAADLDMLSLQLAITQARQLKRPSGEYQNVPYTRLICAPANDFLAYQLTKSPDDPTTSDRGVNPLAGAEHGVPKRFSYLYLTSPNSWFLAAEPSNTGLIWFDRKMPYTKSYTDDDTEVGVVAMRYKMSYGWNNYIGIIGNQGQ